MTGKWMTAQIGLTVGLARMAAQTPARPFGPEAIAAAKRAFIDTVGVALAGSREPEVRMLAATLPAGYEACSLIGGRPLSARDAALLGGAAGHVLDYDDVAVHGHPSVVLVPAILAEAQRLGLSGQLALEAYVIGYEAWAELGRRETGSYHMGSWHPTAMLGTIAATVAVAALGQLVVIPDHRILPEIQYPAFLDDLAEALAWVARNAIAHGGDPNRIVLVGHSAGAYLLAVGI